MSSQESGQPQVKCSEAGSPTDAHKPVPSLNGNFNRDRSIYAESYSPSNQAPSQPNHPLLINPEPQGLKEELPRQGNEAERRQLAQIWNQFQREKSINSQMVNRVHSIIQQSQFPQSQGDSVQNHQSLEQIITRHPNSMNDLSQLIHNIKNIQSKLANDRQRHIEESQRMGRIQTHLKELSCLFRHYLSRVSNENPSFSGEHSSINRQIHSQRNLIGQPVQIPSCEHEREHIQSSEHEREHVQSFQHERNAREFKQTLVRTGTTETSIVGQQREREINHTRQHVPQIISRQPNQQEQDQPNQQRQRSPVIQVVYHSVFTDNQSMQLSDLQIPPTTQGLNPIAQAQEQRIALISQQSAIRQDPEEQQIFEITVYRNTGSGFFNFKCRQEQQRVELRHPKALLRKMLNPNNNLSQKSYQQKLKNRFYINEQTEINNQPAYNLLLDDHVLVSTDELFKHYLQRIVVLTLVGCSIDNTKWAHICENSSSFLPHLSLLNVAGNELLTEVTSEQLKKFKEINQIYFTVSNLQVYEGKNIKNWPLSQKSKAQIRKYLDKHKKVTIQYQ